MYLHLKGVYYKLFGLSFCFLNIGNDTSPCIQDLLIKLKKLHLIIDHNYSFSYLCFVCEFSHVHYTCEEEHKTIAFQGKIGENLEYIILVNCKCVYFLNFENKHQCNQFLVFPVLETHLQSEFLSQTSKPILHSEQLLGKTLVSSQ